MNRVRSAIHNPPLAGTLLTELGQYGLESLDVIPILYLMNRVRSAIHNPPLAGTLLTELDQYGLESLDVIPILCF